MAGRKLTILPLKRKIELIEAVESGKKQKIVADEFKIPANSVSTIMKRKEHYKQQFFFSGQVDASKQRVRLANHDDVESELLRWFTEMRGNNIPIDGPMMKTKATSIAHTLGKDWESGSAMKAGCLGLSTDETLFSKHCVERVLQSTM